MDKVKGMFGGETKTEGDIKDAVQNIAGRDAAASEQVDAAASKVSDVVGGNETLVEKAQRGAQDAGKKVSDAIGSAAETVQGGAEGAKSSTKDALQTAGEKTQGTADKL